LADSDKNLQHINGVRFPIDLIILLIVNLAVILAVCEIFFVSSLKFAVFAFCILVQTPSGGTTSNITVICTSLKSKPTLVG